MAYNPKTPSINDCVIPSKDDWSIPEEHDASDLFLNTSDDQLISIVLAVWKEYMRQDEVKAAISFLENAPCRIKHRDVIRTALKTTRQMVYWSNTFEGHVKKTTPIEQDGSPMKKEVANPLPEPLTRATGIRFSLVRDRIHKPNAEVLDLGCQDGMGSNRLGLLGHKVTGFDLNDHSLSIAREKAKEFNTGAEYVNGYFSDMNVLLSGRKYDYIVSSDAYEHLFDINDLFIPTRELLRDDGRLIIVTPNKCWMQGTVIDWAEPWVYGVKYGKGWLDPSVEREHVIAPTVWTLVNEARMNGWHVEECRAFLHGIDVPGQGNIVLDARPRRSVEPNGQSIIVHCHIRSYDRVRLRELVQQGYDVKLFIDGLTPDEERIEDGFEVRNSEHLHDMECDVFEGDIALFKNVTIRS